ncbi:ATP-binding protein [Aidingimonas halophila]|uniref:histidine kinase n=1 Tax=Aidingimonas halophila TaxID=574349 RepID=A0A1H2YD90_9GAMM|nr:ATP-binding protein [Aidingimonas halophila]GHC34823.1 two-component sensor CbrA [Aidingimonas halophila]SDX03001.1 Two-component sensor kinase CbrA [Aidingimonas halophila]
MSGSFVGICLLGIGYMALLFLCALAVERGWISTRIVRHPIIYTLALGVYASAWATYGSLEFASQSGYGYLAYYLGIAGAFLLAPVLLLPIQRMTRTYQLSSLADLFAFRYRSRWVGALITVVSLLAVWPLLSLQIQTLGEAIGRLSDNRYPALLALAFCAMIALFAIIFGASHTRLHARHDTVIATIALESLIKLAAMLMLGAIALFGIFDGPMELQSWLESDGLSHQTGVTALDAGQWRTLLLLFFAAAFLMPHMFHITFAETLSRRALLNAGWSLPLYLLLMALPIPLILWGAQRAGANPEALGSAYLGFGLNSSVWVEALVFLAGLAAASGTLIILSLALSGMILNHLVLIAHPPSHQPDLDRWLLWLRRGLIATVIFGGWLFYRTIGIHHDLTSLGLTSFVGMAQCLPGILALLYWPGANRKGMVTGLITGVTIWLVGLGWPLVSHHSPIVIIPPGLEMLATEPTWYIVALTSLAANMLTFILVSLITPTSEGERAAAEACSVDAVIRPKRLPLLATNGEECKQFLAQALGREFADREVDRAMADLNLSDHENRPYALRRLRDRIQANLSGLMGPSVAQDIVDRYLPYRRDGQTATDDIHFVENRLEAYRSRLTGLARELDELRRYHRRTLDQLPIGVCAFGDDGELLMWNDALGKLSGIEGHRVVGAHRNSLPPPWCELLGSVLTDEHERLYKQPVDLPSGRRYLTLHRASLQGNDTGRGGSVILLEDHSELKWLEDELVHAARLASIGQLAAGVAHEIGNPITGISSLAQNLRYDTDDPAILETAEHIQQLTDRVSRIVDSLVGFSHGGRHKHALEVAPVTVHLVIDEAMHLIHLARSRQDVEYRNDCDADLCIEGNVQQLVQVFVNLLSNARDASPIGGCVMIDAQRDVHEAHITVTDDGPGIDTSVRDHLFEPFTTTKAAGEGTGLGLSLVYSIIAEHQGHIQAESPLPGQAHGTCIHMWLPLSEKDGDATHEPDSDR